MSTFSLYEGDPYDYIHLIATEFLCKLADILIPFGYVIYPRQYKPQGGFIPDPDTDEDGSNSTTTKDEAKKLKMYSKDFRIESSDGSFQSRWLRIESKITKSASPTIGVLDELKANKNKFRELYRCRPGRSYFLNSRYQAVTRGNMNLKWNKLDSITERKIYYFTVVVNEDMVLVFGGDSPVQSESCIYSNYISFVRMSSMERLGKTKWITNGLMSIYNTEVIVDEPETQKTEPPYARIGNMFKCAERKGYAADWVSPRIIVLPRVNSFVNDAKNENFTLFLTNEFNNHSENRLYYIDSIAKLAAKPCLVLI